MSYVVQQDEGRKVEKLTTIGNKINSMNDLETCNQHLCVDEYKTYAKTADSPFICWFRARVSLSRICPSSVVALGVRAPKFP